MCAKAVGQFLGSLKATQPEGGPTTQKPAPAASSTLLPRAEEAEVKTVANDDALVGINPKKARTRATVPGLGL
jgi:hypothetical protein